MATLGKKEFFETLNRLIGDDSSDEAITALENLTDTFNDFENRTSGSTDWEKRYNENDKMWREKYRARFFVGMIFSRRIGRGGHISDGLYK